MKRFISKYRYEFMFFITLVCYLIYYIPVIDEVTSWCITPYALSYRLGFISRGLIGSLLRFFIPNLTIKHIYIFILANILILCALTIFFMHKIAVRAYDESKSGIIFLLGLFLVNPASIAFLFYWGNYGRFDMYLIMTLIISAILIMDDVCVWIIPFLCVGAVLTHQAFVFQYYPAVLVLVYYFAFVLKKKYGRSIFAMTLLLPCITFIYMQFFSSINYSYSDTMAIIDATTDLPADYITQDMMVKLEYYSSVFDTFGVFVKIPLARNIIKSVVALAVISPMLKLIADIWKEFAAAQSSFIAKLFPVFILAAQLPMFVLTCDYGRDYSAIIISNFVVIFTLYALKDAGITKAVSRLSDNLKAHPAYYVFVIVLCATVGKFTAADIADIGDRFYRIFESFVL
jgi:hypothetical protein